VKYFLTSVVFVALLFAAPAYAETIVMECQNEDGGSLYKYEGGWRGWAVFYQEDGKWLKMQEWPVVSVSNGAATAEYVFGAVADKDYLGSNLKKGDEYQDHQKWVFDFAFFKYTRTAYRTKMDGSPLVRGKEGHDRAKPDIKERLCKKPDESWLDPRKR
jgi:hypothetical protein